jgi:flagellin
MVGANNRGNINGEAPEVDPDNDPDFLTIDLADLKDMSEALNPLINGEIAVVPDPEDLSSGGAQDLGGTGKTGELFNTLDTALDSIASYRATLGSVQSRINSAITNIDISAENMNAARSRIRDVDYAEESTRFTQAQILSAAGTSVLTQANQMPEAVLGLIK